MSCSGIVSTRLRLLSCHIEDFIRLVVTTAFSVFCHTVLNFYFSQGRIKVLQSSCSLRLLGVLHDLSLEEVLSFSAHTETLSPLTTSLNPIGQNLPLLLSILLSLWTNLILHPAAHSFLFLVQEVSRFYSFFQMFWVLLPLCSGKRPRDRSAHKRVPSRHVVIDALLLGWQGIQDALVPPLLWAVFVLKCVQQTYCINKHHIHLENPLHFRKVLPLQCNTSTGNVNPNFSLANQNESLYHRRCADRLFSVWQRSNHWQVKHDCTSSLLCLVGFMVLSSYTVMTIKLCMLTTTSTSITFYSFLST